MNYKKHYDQLINRAKNRTLNCYTENHHIVPRCIGGTDNKDNLVRLTPEEHYIAHQLLCKMYPKNGALVRAAVMMIPNRPNNKLYGWVRRKFAKEMSLSQSKENNSQYGKKWIYSLEQKKSKKIPAGDPIPEGWQIGRKINFGLSKNELKKHRNKEKRLLEEKKKIEKLKPLYQRYVNGEDIVSISKDYQYSYVALYNSFRKYFPRVEKYTGRGNKIIEG